MSGAPTEDSFDSDGETVIGCAPGNIDFSQMRPIEVTEDMSLDGSAENIDVSQMIPQLVTFGPPGDESSKPCIFKVPAILRRHNPKSFTPNSFSFGPLHYKKKKKLQAAEEIKKHYLYDLLLRKPTPQTTQEEFKRSILEVEGRARKCYAFPTDHLDKDQFVVMLILDGCFIIELLRKNFDCIPKYDDDPVFSVSWIIQVLLHDLILLENQIPWFVLERLFDMTSPRIFGKKFLTKLVLSFFGTVFSEWPLPSIPDGVKSNHIVDLLRNSFICLSGKENKTIGKWKLIPTAASLKESGIMLKKCDSSKLLNIKFDKKGFLEIPSLLIQEITCEAFRNLISYEQCYPYCKPKIISYAIFLNILINTTKDINVLCEAGIIDNWLNPNDTLEFFNTIYTDTFVRNFYYIEICQQMNEYTNRWWPRTRVAYARMFRDPIGSLSLFAAAIALILTLLQTLFTILHYIDSR